MFCSKCGKTIHATDVTCPHCQTAIGDNRFGGIPYTSAQFTIAPGQTTFEPVNNYTRTTYTSRGEQAEEGGEVDSRTTYRPVYENEPLPKDLRIELKNGPRIGDVVEDDDTVANFIPGVPLSQAAKETLSELDEELKPDEQIDRSQFKSRPIESTGRAGISRDVSEYIRQLEDSQSRKAARRRGGSQEVYEDYPEPAEGYEPQEDGYADDAYEDDGYYEDIDPEEYEEPRRAPFGIGQIVKIAVALVVVAALVFGLIKWIGYVRGNQSTSPIEGVSQSLYDDGIELVKSHVEAEYVNGLITQYTSDGLLSLSNSLTSATEAVEALMPEEPAANDQTFMNALLAIEKNIGNAVTMDALHAGENDPDFAAESQSNWQTVNNSIAKLETATSAAELTGIINVQPITVSQSTPEPATTEVPETYNTLSKGDENNDVMRLQVRLYELGYLDGDRDGVFGSMTATAVGLFQQAIGMEPTGYADNETQIRLYADDAPYAAGATTPTPAPTATPEPAPTDEPIQPAGADEAGEGNVV